MAGLPAVELGLLSRDNFLQSPKKLQAFRLRQRRQQQIFRLSSSGLCSRENRRTFRGEPHAISTLVMFSTATLQPSSFDETRY